jgi:hypothetical protein
VGARFFAHVQTGPGAHPASCTMCTGSFPGGKRPGRGADHPPPLAPRLRMSRAIPLRPLWALGGLYRVSFILPLHKNSGLTGRVAMSLIELWQRFGRILVPSYSRAKQYSKVFLNCFSQRDEHTRSFRNVRSNTPNDKVSHIKSHTHMLS